MSQSTVAIIGSGIAGTTIAYLLSQQGYDVHLFEIGPDYPYPFAQQFNAIMNLDLPGVPDLTDSSLRRVTVSGDVPNRLNTDRRMRVGGMATSWQAITLRMRPDDFRLKSRFGRGVDWPLTYDELEPYYVRAEQFLGVAGTDDDNPFASPRSQPYPLPPFALGYEDRLLADKLKDGGITLHTTPQARTRVPFESRPACVNFSTCEYCPIGARYAPNYHLQLALQSGLCTLETGMVVRRIVTDDGGRARALLVHNLADGSEREHAADVIVLAAGALESARLLLLSANGPHPDGLGNTGGHVGRHLEFHRIYRAALRYRDPVYPGRTGFWTGQSEQFTNHERRGEMGGVKIEFSANGGGYEAPDTLSALDDLTAYADGLHTRNFSALCESDRTDDKYLRLSDEDVDRFGDPFAHVHYESSPFDEMTYDFIGRVLDRFEDVTGAEAGPLSAFNRWSTGSHHLGGCRMGSDIRNSVVNRYGAVHDTPGVYLAGSGIFAATSAVNPTLTILALAIQTADYMLEQLRQT